MVHLSGAKGLWLWQDACVRAGCQDACLRDTYLQRAVDTRELPLHDRRVHVGSATLLGDGVFRRHLHPCAVPDRWSHWRGRVRHSVLHLARHVDKCWGGVRQGVWVAGPQRIRKLSTSMHVHVRGDRVVSAHARRCK